MATFRDTDSPYVSALANSSLSWISESSVPTLSSGSLNSDLLTVYLYFLLFVSTVFENQILSLVIVIN